MNPDVQKLIEEYGLEIAAIAELIEGQYAAARDHNEGWQAAYEGSYQRIAVARDLGYLNALTDVRDALVDAEAMFGIEHPRVIAVLDAIIAKKGFP